MAIASWPARCAVCSPAAASISAMTTRAPSRANNMAVARPMPAPPPVMKATLPSSRAIAHLPSVTQFARHVVYAVDGQRKHPATHQVTHHIDRPHMPPASLRRRIEPRRATVVPRQPFQPDRTCLFVPMLHGTARHADLVRTHRRVPDEDQLVVRPISPQHLPRWHDLIMPPAIVLPQPLIRA